MFQLFRIFANDIFWSKPRIVRQKFWTFNEFGDGSIKITQRSKFTYSKYMVEMGFSKFLVLLEDAVPQNVFQCHFLKKAKDYTSKNLDI